MNIKTLLAILAVFVITVSSQLPALAQRVEYRYIVVPNQTYTNPYYNQYNYRYVTPYNYNYGVPNYSYGYDPRYSPYINNQYYNRYGYNSNYPYGYDLDGDGRYTRNDLKQYAIQTGINAGLGLLFGR